MFSPLPKSAGRLRDLGARRLVRAALRRGPHELRCAWEELTAREEPAERLLLRLVPGAANVAEATQRIANGTGSLTVPRAAIPELMAAFKLRFPEAADALVAHAEQACVGRWDILGSPGVELGIRPDWQLDFRSGQSWDSKTHHRRIAVARGDGSDIKVPWEISRLQHLPSVAYAFRLTSEPRFAELVATQLQDWIERNPAGFGVNWSCAMDVALRSVSMSWAFELCRDDPRVAAVAPLVYASLWAHGRFLETHLEDHGMVVGNHYIADLLGLCWLGALYPVFPEAKRWASEGRARLIAQLPRQIRPDGGDFEASVPYHRLVLELLGLAAQVLEANGLGAPELVEAAARMAGFTAAVLKPDGTAPQIGDNDGGRAFRLLPRKANDHRYLASWIAMLANSAALAAETLLDPEAFLLVGPRALERYSRFETAAPRPPQRERSHQPSSSMSEAIRFADSGICVARRGEFYVLLAATPVGQDGAGGHGHNDKLGIEIYLGGDLVVDPGTFVYTADPAARNRFRGTAAHATVQVDGREQNPISRDLFFLPERSRARVTRWEQQGDVWIWEAEHRGFHPNLHRRRVSVDLARRSVEIEDQLLGNGAHEVAARFPLAPGLSARSVDGGRVRLDRPAAQAVELAAHGPPALTLAIEDGRYSPTYGAQQPCTCVVWKVRAELPCTLSFRFEPVP